MHDKLSLKVRPLVPLPAAVEFQRVIDQIEPKLGRDLVL